MWLAVLTVGELVRALFPVEVVQLRAPSSFVFFSSGKPNCYRLSFCHQQELMEWCQLSYLRRLVAWIYLPVFCFFGRRRPNQLCSSIDRVNGAKFWRVAGIADCLVRLNQVRLINSLLQHRVKKFIQIQAKVIPSSVLKGLLPGKRSLQLYALDIDFGNNIHQL